MKRWFAINLYGSPMKVVEFANRHRLQVGEVLLLHTGSKGRLTVMYYSEKELSQV